MWQSTQERINPNIIRYTFSTHNTPISNSEIITLLKTSVDFIQFFIDTLKDAPFDAFFWEVKPINKETLKDSFEFVLVKSSRLKDLKPDNSRFLKYFQKDEQAVTFSNLRGDANLIVPTPTAEMHCYPHLAAFIHHALLEQQIALWKLVATTFETLISDTPKWLSTAGLGVSWLHIRIDSRPKYYRYQSYKAF